jgi:hypothetical protein
MSVYDIRSPNFSQKAYTDRMAEGMRRSFGEVDREIADIGAKNQRQSAIQGSPHTIAGIVPIGPEGIAESQRPWNVGDVVDKADNLWQAKTTGQAIRAGTLGSSIASQAQGVRQLYSLGRPVVGKTGLPLTGLAGARSIGGRILGRVALPVAALASAYDVYRLGQGSVDLANELSTTAKHTATAADLDIRNLNSAIQGYAADQTMNPTIKQQMLDSLQKQLSEAQYRQANPAAQGRNAAISGGLGYYPSYLNYVHPSATSYLNYLNPVYNGNFLGTGWSAF